MEDKKKNLKGFVREFLPYIIIILIVVIIKSYIVSPIRVNGSSMKNTLHDKDIMILDEISYRFTKIKRFDIVVVHYQNEYLIKRVIGLPGDNISYQNNQLYVNGKKVQENFEHAHTDDFSTVKVPKGKYFVLGDNRINSSDSRVLGFFDKKDIKGKTNLIIFPLSRVGIKK